MSWENFAEEEWSSCGANFDFTSDLQLLSSDHCISPTAALRSPAHADRFTAALQDTPTPTTTDSTTCPSCLRKLAAGMDLRSHVGPCFVASKQTKLEGSPVKLNNHIDSIRQSATRMSLTDRISLLESLTRLAHPTRKRARSTDLLTLTLLYKSPSQRKAPILRVPKRRKLKIKVEIPAGTKRRSRPASTISPRPAAEAEAFTPTVKPLQDFVSGEIPLSKGSSKFLLRSASKYKRGREIAQQALSFSPPTPVPAVDYNTSTSTFQLA